MTRSSTIPALLPSAALLSSIALLSLAACDAQVDSEHQGEALASLQGTLQTKTSMPPPHPEVAVVWARRTMMREPEVAERVDAEGLFPQFKLSIYSPPPADELDELDGVKFAVAYIVVGSPDIDYTQYSAWHGVDFNHLLLYLPDGAPEGSQLSGFFRGVATPGFHVYDSRRPGDVEYQAWFTCVNNALQGDTSGVDHVYLACPGTGNDVISPAPADLDTELGVDVLDNTGIVQLINNLPRW